MLHTAVLSEAIRQSVTTPIKVLPDDWNKCNTWEREKVTHLTRAVPYNRTRSSGSSCPELSRIWPRTRSAVHSTATGVLWPNLEKSHWLNDHLISRLRKRMSSLQRHTAEEPGRHCPQSAGVSSVVLNSTVQQHGTKRYTQHTRVIQPPGSNITCMKENHASDDQQLAS